MIISRKVFDPTWPMPNNKVARTVGFYGHTPKYWKCSEYDFDSYWKMQTTDTTLTVDGEKYTMKRQYELEDPWIIDCQERAEEQRVAHASCRKNKRHRSYVGYLCWVGPKKTSILWFMGNPYRHKLFERGNSGTMIFRGKIIHKRVSPFDEASPIISTTESE